MVETQTATPTEPPVAVDALQPFPSIMEVRGVHAALMKRMRDRSRSPRLVNDIAVFIRRVAATGAVLRSTASRDAAQNILDFWSASLITLPDVDRGSVPAAMLAPCDNSVPPDTVNARNPYIGLGAFDEASAGQFYGRDDSVRAVLEKIEQHRMVFIIGPVGGGKSSLVAAGVLPRLGALGARSGAGQVIVPTVAPGSEPLAALLRALHGAKPDKEGDGFGTWIAQQTSRLKRKPATICDVLKETIGEHPAILVVDSFEEIFTLCQDIQERTTFAECLAALAKSEPPLHKVILIIRDDMAEDSLRLPALKTFGEDLSARFSPPPPTVSELLQIVMSPAEAAELQFEDGIIEDLARSVAGEVTALPLLQFTLRQLWAARDGNRVTWDAYLRIGKPREALRRTTERIYDSLSADDKDVAKQIFLRLVTLSPYDQAHGGLVIRRRVLRSTLMELGSHEQVGRVLDDFTSASLIRLTPGPSADDDRFEVAHEALLTNWPLLDEWLRTERQSSERKLRVISTARLYRQTQEKGYLLDGGALEEAEKYAQEAPEVADLVAASKSRGKSRRWIGIGAAVLVTASVMAGNSGYDWLYRTYAVPFFLPGAIQAIKSNNTAPASKQSELRWLAKYDQIIDATLATLKELDLSGLSMQPRQVQGSPERVGAQFKSSKIIKVNFAAAEMVSASFGKAPLSGRSTIDDGSTFDDANLIAADFQDVAIRQTTFKRAALVGAHFDRAEFCGDVSFEDADLRETSFNNIVFGKDDSGRDQVPNFKGSVWWLATGWTRQQWDALNSQPQDAKALVGTSAYRKAVEWHDPYLRSAPGPTFDRAMYLNNKAWTIAQFGSNLPEAELLSREALSIMANMGEFDPSIGRLAPHRANFQDTLAYILLQEDGKTDEAVELWKKAAPVAGNPAIVFRYSVALFAQGDKPGAFKQLTLAVAGPGRVYKPSHELHLLRQYIQGDFKAKLEKLVDDQPKPSTAQTPQDQAQATAPCAELPKRQ